MSCVFLGYSQHSQHYSTASGSPKASMSERISLSVTIWVLLQALTHLLQVKYCKATLELLIYVNYYGWAGLTWQCSERQTRVNESIAQILFDRQELHCRPHMTEPSVLSDVRTSNDSSAKNQSLLDIQIEGREGWVITGFTSAGCWSYCTGCYRLLGNQQLSRRWCMNESEVNTV